MFLGSTLLLQPKGAGHQHPRNFRDPHTVRQSNQILHVTKLSEDNLLQDPTCLPAERQGHEFCDPAAYARRLT